jgi:histone arginine demethylase JMJD6
MATQTVELARSSNVVVYKKWGISPAEFERDHARASVPVVLAEATQDWQARETFSAELFRSRFGDREVHVGERSYPLAQLLTLLEESSPERPAPYPCNFHFAEVFPELAQQVEPRYPQALPDRTYHPLIPRRLLGQAATFEIFFGGPGGQFPYMHYDYMGFHAFINQLVGHKEFTVIPPEHTPYVYPDPEQPWRSRVENHHQPDLSKYPLFARAERVSFVVGPGETLFIPNGWWHTARSLDLTISIAFDMLNDTNWERFRREVWLMMRSSRKTKQRAVDLYLRALGRMLSLEERARGHGRELVARVRGRTHTSEASTAPLASPAVVASGRSEAGRERGREQMSQADRPS